MPLYALENQNGVVLRARPLDAAHGSNQVLAAKGAVKLCVFCPHVIGQPCIQARLAVPFQAIKVISERMKAVLARRVLQNLHEISLVRVQSQRIGFQPHLVCDRVSKFQYFPTTIDPNHVRHEIEGKINSAMIEEKQDVFLRPLAWLAGVFGFRPIKPPCDAARLLGLGCLLPLGVHKPRQIGLGDAQRLRPLSLDQGELDRRDLRQLGDGRFQRG